MQKSIYERNFNLLVKLEIITPEGVPTFKEAKKMKSGAFMDLNLDYLASTEKGIVIAMAHNFVQNGDVMADPDMEVRIARGVNMVEALSYRQDSLGINNHVYNETETQVNPRLKKELNKFLNTWLNNLIKQGFSGRNDTKPIMKLTGEAKLTPVANLQIILNGWKKVFEGPANEGAEAGFQHGLKKAYDDIMRAVEWE